MLFSSTKNISAKTRNRRVFRADLGESSRVHLPQFSSLLFCLKGEALGGIQASVRISLIWQNDRLLEEEQECFDRVLT